MIASPMSRDLETLEQIVDRNGIADVLHMLAEICGEKSAHVAVNWQDMGLSRAWERNGERLMAAAGKLDLVA